MATSYVPLPAGLPLKQEKPGSSTQWPRCTRAPRGTALAPFEDQSGWGKTACLQVWGNWKFPRLECGFKWRRKSAFKRAWLSEALVLFFLLRFIFFYFFALIIIFLCPAKPQADAPAVWAEQTDARIWLWIHYLNGYIYLFFSCFFMKRGRRRGVRGGDAGPPVARLVPPVDNCALMAHLLLFWRSRRKKKGFPRKKKRGPVARRKRGWRAAPIHVEKLGRMLSLFCLVVFSYEVTSQNLTASYSGGGVGAWGGGV